MQVNHTMTQLMTERETLRAEVERQDRKIERLRMALLKITAIIETQSDPDIDAMHDVAREALNR